MIVSPATVNIDIVAPSDGAGTEKTDTSSKVRANNSGVDGTGPVPVDPRTTAAVAAVAAVAAGTVEETLLVDVLVAGAVDEVVVSDPTDDGEPTVLFDVVADRPASDPHAASDDTATSSTTAVRRFTQPSDQWHQPNTAPRHLTSQPSQGVVVKDFTHASDDGNGEKHRQPQMSCRAQSRFLSCEATSHSPNCEDSPTVRSTDHIGNRDGHV